MRHPYSDFLARVDKPSRYVGGEYQEVRKDPATVRARVCLAFPDVYEIGMSHLGTKILYGILNKTDGVACERTFSPWLDCEAELRARGLPVLTLESASPLRDFDVIGFSLQYELTYTNVLNLLDLSGLPLRAADRGDDAPFVIAGGPTATHPEPLAPFIDAFFIGEAEEQLPPLVLEVAELRRAGVPRRERLIRLAAKYPLYVPELYTTKVDDETGFVVVDAPTDARVPARPKRVWVDDINRFPFPDDSPLPYAEAIFDRMAVEVARGCTEGCRFCQAGMIYRPVRERDPVAVIDALVGGVKKGGYDETALTSLSTADYSCVTPLVKAAMAKLRDEKVSLSVSSLRAYGLNEDLLGEMATVRAGGLTFAPEAGTQRMRDVITKNVTEEDISESAHRVFGRGFQRMKLYFMIGLPTEEDVDVRGIVETAGRVQSIGREHLSGAKVVASVSTHVPKPHTPFQWCAMDTESETERKQALLAQTAKRLRVDLKMHENKQSHIEGIFSRGDRRAADLLERAFRLGCRFDSWDDELRMDLWEQAIEAERAEHGLDIDRYLGTIPVTARVPWDHIDIGLDPDFLVQEYRKALKDRLSPPCGKIYKRLLHPNNVADAEALAAKKLVCYDCGVACDLEGMKEERLYYLRRMNAWTPPVPAVAQAPRDETTENAENAEKALHPNAKPQPKTRIVQGEAHRYRLRYAKLGRAAYLGHLDLVRHLPRIFRRAGLEMFYSLGFHPKPELSFGPALGLGIPSLGELLDVSLTDDLGADELLARLRPVSLPGIEMLEATRLGNNDRALGRVVARAEFAARLPQDLTSADAAGGVERFAGEAPLSTRRDSDKGIARMIDVRRSLEMLVPFDDAGADVRERLDWTTGRLVRFAVSVSHEGSARPIEVVRALWGDDVAARADFARLALRATRGRGSHARRAPAQDRRRGRRAARRSARGRVAVIETQGLTKAFGPKVAVSSLSLRVDAGEVMGFLGPNGSGKTTTIRLLMGLLRPTSGQAAILGRDCHTDAVALKREVGYLPDEPFLYPYLAGREILELCGGLHGFAPAEARRRAGALAERLGLGAAAGAYTVTYSLGMKKRLALAMALIHDPRVLIMDEPTNGLDPKGAREMRATISELAAGGRTIFLSTHLLDAAEKLCHRVAIIRDGALQAVGAPAELRARFAATANTSLEDLFLRVTEGASES